MTNKVIVKNSTVAGKRPAAGSGSPGELFVNVADQVIGTFDAAGAPVELGQHVTQAVTPFSTTKSYAVGDMVTQGGGIYKATAIAPAGAFDATKWAKIAGTFTAGSIPFADTGGALTEDNAALFWDKANKRLGVGTNIVGAKLSVEDTSQVSAAFYRSLDINSVGAASTSINLGALVGATRTDGAKVAGGLDSATVGNFAIYTKGSASGPLQRYVVKGLGEHYWQTGEPTTTKMQLTPTGQLGIGVVPTATDPLLTVNSDAKINGMTVGKGAGNKSSNILIGSNAAFEKNTTGDNSVVIGASALAVNTTGYNNVAIGSSTLAANVGGYQNTAIGLGALSANVGGYDNFGLGKGSLNSNVSGYGNIAIGVDAGRLVTGNNNVIIGIVPGEAAMNNTVIIADGAGGEKVRWLTGGAMQIGQTAEPTGIAGKLHLWFNGTNLMMKVGTGAATIVK